jgi:hypothetical protein
MNMPDVISHSFSLNNTGSMKSLLTTIALIVGSFLITMTGCGEEKLPTRDELFNREMELPTLFISQNTGKHVIGPASKPAFIDEETNEVCWPARICLNPDCPKKTVEGDPYFFIMPLAEAMPDTKGKPKVANTDSAPPTNGNGLCPACFPIRDVKNETQATRQKYVNWAKSYVLPETAKKMKEIEAARKERISRKRGH